ncbi:MAG: 3-hydroxyacyl-CoA dehydrogenase family protein [Planctomycetota bacterium]
MDIRSVLVVGAGTMGRGIAQVAALGGYQAVLFDVAPDLVTAGLAQVETSLAKGVSRGKITPQARDAALGRLSAAAEMAPAAAAADLVVEAVPEDLGLKCSVFRDLGRYAPPHTILATNTSSLTVSEIAEASRRPERVLGMHFFNPVPILTLLELVRTDRTGDDVVEAARQVGERMGKTVIVVDDSPGFCTSRLGVALALEAIRMVEEGVASAEDIDTAMKLGYRHPMGPLEVTDLVGLDVRLGIAKHLARTLDDRRFEPPALMRRMVAEGRLGKKSGEGFFRWP